MMSLLALPPVYAATRDGLQAVPGHMREAAFALGKTRITTIRRVLLPSVRSNIATGVTLGISRIIGSTAIVLILLGEHAAHRNAGVGPGLNVLRGTGSSLTSYVYDNSPAGEGGAPQKAYAAAFVLLIFVLALNLRRRTHRPRPGQRDRARRRSGRSSERSLGRTFSQIARKAANLSDLMAKVKVDGDSAR